MMKKLMINVKLVSRSSPGTQDNVASKRGKVKVDFKVSNFCSAKGIHLSLSLGNHNIMIYICVIWRATWTMLLLQEIEIK